MGAFAHELKTPMTSIIGYADMLRTLQIDPAEQHEAAGAIYHESRRLEALSYKLLSLLSLSDERLELAPVDLTDLWCTAMRTCCWTCCATWCKMPPRPARQECPSRCCWPMRGTPWR